MTSEDAQKLQTEEKELRQHILEKTSSQLMAAIAPKVDAKLNEYGIVKP